MGTVRECTCSDVWHDPTEFCPTQDPTAASSPSSTVSTNQMKGTAMPTTHEKPVEETHGPISDFTIGTSPEPGRWMMVGDFRRDFPSAEGAYGNNSIADELRRRVAVAFGARVAAEFDVDSEWSALFLTGPSPEALLRLRRLLQAMLDDGWAVEPC